MSFVGEERREERSERKKREVVAIFLCNIFYYQIQRN